jgi:predicted DNA-binding transcriptional regulator YafY
MSLVLLLQARGRMTAQELADELEVSLRTIYRDVESLSGAGVPVYADRGPAGGYRLLDGYRTRLTGLTTDEASSLFLAGLPGAAAELGLGAAVATAELKLLAALPKELSDRAARVRERFHLDAPGWYRDAEEIPFLGAVADAVWHQDRLRIAYRRWDTSPQVSRVLEPLGLVLKAGVWYLVARTEGQDRTYRVTRIEESESLGERFERPAGFDLMEFWRNWSDRFSSSLYTGEARVRFSPAAASMLTHLLLPAVVRGFHATAGAPDGDGWVEAVIPIESIRHAHRELLRFGAEVEVLEPPELRDRVAESVRSMAKIYT